MISIVIPNFNKRDLIRRSLDSVLAQTIEDWEAIVVDDASTDGSLDIAREYARRDARIKLLENERNRGGCYSRNRGAAEAKGDYLMFLDSDDSISPDCLTCRLAEFDTPINQDVDMMVFPMATVKGERQNGMWRWNNKDDALLAFLRHRIAWSIMMPIWRRAAFVQTGGFDESFPRMQDVELHTRSLLRGLRYRIAKRDTPDCFYYIDEDRMTMNHAQMCERFVAAIGLFIDKMRNIIIEGGAGQYSRRKLMNALYETVLAGVRFVGDAYQAERLTAKSRDDLYVKLRTIGSSRLGLRLYMRCYRMRMNKIKGFNFVFRHLYRLGRYV